MRKSIKTSFLSAVLCYNETNIKGLHEVQSQEVVIMTRGIRVKNTDDIQKINKIVTRYGFDIWIHGKSGMVDAKSRPHCSRILRITWRSTTRTNFSRITAFAVQFNIFRNGAVLLTAPFLFSYAIQEIEMIFPFPLRGSGCCSYGVSIPADYKTRREKLRKEVSPFGFLLYFTAIRWC